VADPVILITGASSGVGAAAARHAAAAGFRVVLGARSLEKLRELADELGGSERALAVACDVTEWDDQQALVNAALESFGRVDVALANAGIGAVRGYTDSTPERWRTMILTNVYGAALTVRAALPSVITSRGHIVLIGSVAGRVGIRGSLYSATKWAVTGMAEGLRIELHGTGVRVTVVEPGGIATSFHGSPEVGAQPIDPAGALSADDVARVVMFAVQQPASVAVNEILLRPTSQEI
jgi:NADP-dependent 3-hydroxy acid dehydrogenase YdfG